MRALRRPAIALVAACCLGCGDSPTSPDRANAAEIDRLLIFVRDWPSEYVEIDFRRSDGKSTLIMYRPPQPGIPRVLIDSVGPATDDPPEIVELLRTWDVWALADSNAVDAACSTRTGQWRCNPTVNDYSLVMAVTRGGVSRSQRYTRLDEIASSRTARALGDYVFAWSRKRAAGAPRPDR